MARYIDADALVSDLENGKARLEYVEFGDFVGALIDVITTIINRAPTADVVPVRHWKSEEVKDDLMGEGYTWLKCSDCGVHYRPNARMHYCPSCGAKMDMEM